MTAARTGNYRRVLLKLSGEMLLGERTYNIGPRMLNHIAGEIAATLAVRPRLQLMLVIGGGNIIRGGAVAANGIDRVTGDYMGMLATVINALALQNAIEQQNIPTRVLSAVEAPKICEPFIRRRAQRHLEKGRVVIFAGGTGNPYFSTDMAAALRANEMSAEVILKATKVNGVYSADPEESATARMYTQLTHLEVIKKSLRVMDITAITLCMENRIPIVVFNLMQKRAVKKVIMGERIGTRIVVS